MQSCITAVGSVGFLAIRRASATPSRRSTEAGRAQSAVRCSLESSERSDAATRRNLLLTGAILPVFLQTKPACATDFEEIQAQREARKQAMLEAARAKATGEPVPEVPPDPVYEAPSVKLDTSKLSYPGDQPAKESKSEKKAPAKTKTKSKAKAAKAEKNSSKKAGNSDDPGFLTTDKRALGAQRAARKAELLEKARAKALSEGSAPAPEPAASAAPEPIAAE